MQKNSDVECIRDVLPTLTILNLTYTNNRIHCICIVLEWNSEVIFNFINCLLLNLICASLLPYEH